MNDDKGVNPFGFHFEFDRDKYEENKKRIKRQSKLVSSPISFSLQHLSEC